MRRKLFKFLNVLSSYPVLVLLGLSICGILYFGLGSRSIEFQWQNMLSQSVQLRQEQQQLDSELQGLRQSDAYRRSQIFQQQFIAENEVENERFRREFRPVFESQGWELKSAKAGELPVAPANQEASIATNFRSVEVEVVATAQIVNPISGSVFLPFHSIDRIADYLWRKPPTKEIKSLRIERNTTEYTLQAVFFYPLANDHNSPEELSE
jgi:hypothetical protein